MSAPLLHPHSLIHCLILRVQHGILVRLVEVYVGKVVLYEVVEYGNILLG